MKTARQERHEFGSRSGGKIPSRSSGQTTVLTEEVFEAMLVTERRRAERSRKRFALACISSTAHGANAGKSLEQASTVLRDSVRESDLVGWYEQKSVLGVLFTEIGNESTAESLRSKVLRILRDNVTPGFASHMAVTIHMFPENWGKEGTGSGADTKLYPELSRKNGKGRISVIAKRAIDIAGSAALLLILSPLLALIAAVIKLTSRGPVIFRQERLGQFARTFECLKFRTMYSNSNPAVHREYVRNFIADKAGSPIVGTKSQVYKLVNDPRITPFGRILRRASLDELPQFWNVLRGDMSLVGPRPPLDYEFEAYDIWHQRRVTEVKPGVTGLWQVSGRSRTSFDDMVRLDLRYCREWSLWMDVKILLATPLAVFIGDGAF